MVRPSVEKIGGNVEDEEVVSGCAARARLPNRKRHSRDRRRCRRRRGGGRVWHRRRQVSIGGCVMRIKIELNVFKDEIIRIKSQDEIQ